MAVRIRLQRHGRKKRPFYRLVAADARAQRDGAFLERLGHYNPLTDPAEIFIHEDRALKWLRRGAQPSDTAKRLLSKCGILLKFEYEKLGRPLPGLEPGAEVPESEAVVLPEPESSEPEEASRREPESSEPETETAVEPESSEPETEVEEDASGVSVEERE